MIDNVCRSLRLKSTFTTCVGLSLVAVSSVVTLAEPALAGSLLKVSDATFAAFQHKDFEKMGSLTTPDFVYVGKEGVLSGPELAEATKGCTLHSYDLSEPELRQLGPDTALLVYKANQDEECDGKPEASTLYVADLFKKEKGKWFISVHAEAPKAL